MLFKFYTKLTADFENFEPSQINKEMNRKKKTVIVEIDVGQN